MANSTKAAKHLYRLGAASTGVGCKATTATGHQIYTDLPRAMGGTNRYAQPVETLIASLLGCKVATAHFVARHLWQRPHNRILGIEFRDVEAGRDDRGALALPITRQPPVSAALQFVNGVVRVRPVSSCTTADDVSELGRLVEERCPVAATLTAAGCQLHFEWVIDAPPDPELEPGKTS